MAKGLRIGTANVKNEQIKNLSFTSEVNQWKVHKSGFINYTSNSTIRQPHGLTYTPLLIMMTRESGTTYYQWSNSNAYVDNYNYSDTKSSGDLNAFVLIKDVGA